MTRELKFRAWDKRFKKMDFGRGDLLLRHNSTDYEPVEQFTGLQDRNGTDIYEADIVTSGENIAQVRFSVLGGGFFAAKLDDFNSMTGWPNSFVRRGGQEIIGNIHENPELLETQ